MDKKYVKYIETKIRKLEKQLFEKYGDLDTTKRGIQRKIEQDELSVQIKELQKNLEMYYLFDPQAHKQQGKWVKFSLRADLTMYNIKCPNCAYDLSEHKFEALCPRCQQRLRWSKEFNGNFEDVKKT